MKSSLLIDASPLISFLKIEQFDLLKVLNLTLAYTDFVRAEIKRPREALKKVIADKRLQEIPLHDASLLIDIENLYEEGLGRGEASSIVLAEYYQYALLVDDEKARRVAAKRKVFLYSTSEVIIKNIQFGNLTLDKADSFIETWRSLGEFPVSCRSFKEQIS